MCWGRWGWGRPGKLVMSAETRGSFEYQDEKFPQGLGESGSHAGNRAESTISRKEEVAKLGREGSRKDWCSGWITTFSDPSLGGGGGGGEPSGRVHRSHRGRRETPGDPSSRTQIEGWAPARGTPCKPSLARREPGKKETPRSTWSESQKHQGLLSTWSLERLPFQIPHLPEALRPATGGYRAGLGEGSPARPPSAEPAPGAGRPAAAPCLFADVCIHVLGCLPCFFFFLSSQFSSVPKFTPSGTSASAPPLLGTAFCLSGSLGSMGVCDDNSTRAYITLFILQALRRQSLMNLRAAERPGGCSGGQRTPSPRAEARGEGGAGQRPGLPGSPRLGGQGR